jgi:acid phosphatase (class A)
MNRFTSLALALVVVASSLAADGPAHAAESKFLAPGTIDAAKLLPPPPADGSPRQLEEMAELHRIEAARTADQLAQAQADAKNETVTMFAAVLGPSFDIAKLPATAQLFGDIANEEVASAKPAKTFFHRARPYTTDPSLKSCAEKTDKPEFTSYPSGHSTVGYAMGVVLASLIPSRAQAILARSEDFAENRLVCGVHYRSDITAGEAFGTVLALDLMRNAAFRREYDAAAAELRAQQIQ